jgi:nitroreductase
MTRVIVIPMEFYHVVETRRSIRSYQSTPIPEESLNRIMEAARVAPSGQNRQPWKFILVQDEMTRREVASRCENQMWIGEAPLVVVACGSDINYNRGEYMGEMSFLVDVSIAFTHLILAARAEGLGTCWIGDFSNDGLKELLNIPKDVDVVGVTPVGYPRDEEFTLPGDRKSREDITSTDFY